MREEATTEELIEIAEDAGLPDEELNVTQKILIGKFILWLDSFQCPASYQANTAYSMMKDIWDTVEEYCL